MEGPAWVQDAGRPGQMWQGVPPGGAWVPERAAVARRAVGDPRAAALVEYGGGLVIAARGGDLRVSIAGFARTIERDHVVVVPPPARVAYLAVAGGLEVPRVLGGRGLLRSAGLGGGFGRPLAAGDRLAVGHGVAGEEDVCAWEPNPAATIRVVRGPDGERFEPEMWEQFCASQWRVGAGSDRVGLRLAGTGLRRSDADAARSTPMVEGVIQVPASGAPIVLGPDHPTTGGYPVLGVVIRADRGALFVKPPGAEVRFAAVSLDEAREATRLWRVHFG